MPPEAAAGGTTGLRVAHVNLAKGYRGGERQTELLIRELARRGIEQRILHRRGSPIGDRLDGVDGLQSIPVSFPFLHRGFSLRSSDVLHAHDGRAVGLTMVGSLILDRPAVVTRRMNRRPSATSSSLLARADVLVGLSRGVVQSLEEATGRRDVRRIPSAHSALPFEAERVAELRRRDDGRFVVLSAGAYEFGAKGLDHLIAAARLLERTNPDVRIRTVGRGPDGERLRAAAAELSNLVVDDWVWDLGNHLRAADVFVLPSNHEGLGSVVLDAMAAGLPVVSTRIPGPTDVVEHETNGLLVAPGDAVDLAAGLKRLADDELLRARLAARAVRTAEDFTAERMAERYLRIYGEVLERRRNR